MTAYIRVVAVGFNRSSLSLALISGVLIGEGVYRLRYTADTTYSPFWWERSPSALPFSSKEAVFWLHGFEAAVTAALTSLVIARAFFAIYSRTGTAFEVWCEKLRADLDEAALAHGIGRMAATLTKCMGTAPVLGALGNIGGAFGTAAAVSGPAISTRGHLTRAMPARPARHTFHGQRPPLS